MENRHCIESAVLQIAYSSEELAMSQHDQLETFAKSELLAIVDEAFSEISGPDMVHGFDRLEIDLGEISLAYFYEDFGTKLKDKIRECLENELAQHQVDTTGNHARITKEHSELEIICQFIESGRVPWNANFTQQNEVDNLLARVVASNGKEVIAFIRGGSNRNEMITRLSAQFPSHLLSVLLVQLIDVKPDELDYIVDRILTLATGSFGLARPNIERRVWAEIFQFALLSRSQRLGVKDVIARITQAISFHVPHRYSVFLNRLIEYTQRDSRDLNLHTLILSVAKDGVGAEALGEKVSNVFNEADPSRFDTTKDDQESRFRRLTHRARLVEALNTGSISRLKPIWESLRKEYSTMLKEVIFSLGLGSHVRRNIARKFTEIMIRDIVEVLEPSNFRFIEQLVNEPKIYLQASEELQMQESEARKSLWEFTLTYLLVERGSRFNKKSYIASMMSKLASHLNIEVMELYYSLMTMLESVSQKNAMQVELLDFLVELSDDAGNRASAAGLDPHKTTEKGLAARHGSEEPPHLNNVEGRPDIDDTPPARAVRALNLAFEGTDLSELKSVWALLLHKHRSWLTSTIQTAGQKAEVRQNISKSFSNPMFKAVIYLIEPVHGNYISEVLHRSTTKTGITGKRQQVVQKTKRIVREFTLTYLLVDRGSRFNKKSYLSGLLKKMAAHENVSVLSIFHSVKTSLKSAAYMNALQKEVLQLLNEVGQELRVQTVSNEPTDKPVKGLAGIKNDSDREEAQQFAGHEGASGGSKKFEQLELIRAYLLYEKLVREVASVGSVGSKISYHVVRLVHELIESYPWILHRFNQDVNAGRLSLASVMAELPRSLQRKLLLSYFSSFSIKYHFGQSEFLKRIEALERQSFFTKYSYQLVLEKLIGNQTKNLDEIVDLQELSLGSTVRRSSDPDLVTARAESLDQLGVRDQQAQLEQHKQKTSVDQQAEKQEREQQKRQEQKQQEQKVKSEQQRQQDLKKKNQQNQQKKQREQQLERIHQEQERRKLQEQHNRLEAETRIYDAAPLPLNQGTTDLIRAYLLGHLTFNEQDKSSIVSTIELLVSSHPNALVQLLKESLTEKSASDRLTNILPESLLVKLMLLLRPDDYFKAILHADLMAMAAVGTEESNSTLSGKLHLAKWQFVFNYMVIEGNKFNEVSFVRRFSVYLAERSSSKTLVEFTKRLSSSINIISSPATHIASVRIAMILGSASITIADGDDKLRQQDTSAENDRHGQNSKSDTDYQDAFDVEKESSPNSVFDFFDEDENEDSNIEEDIYIDNAGLVLLAPYFPRYFEMLNLLKDNRFRDREAAERGVHLLQYLLNGSTDSFEYQLVLNKLLCGVEAGIPIVKSIEITEKEKEASEGLLRGVIANWPVLKNTSIEGLQESFLQREAHLQLKDDAWALLVQSKAFDMLMDSMPWSFSTIKLAWMKRPIHVDWR